MRRAACFFALVALSFNCVRGQESGDPLDQIGFEEEIDIDPREHAVLSEVAAVYSEIGEIRARGNSSEEIAQHRSYRLIPTLRDVSRKAEELASTALLGKAVELASCESEAARSYEWIDVFTKAANSFSERDFRAAVERLPEVNRRSFKEAVAGNLPGSFKWRDVVDSISGGDEGETDWLEQVP